MRSWSVSSVSVSRTGTAAWARIGPVSTPASTRCTVQPVIFTPWARASRTPWAPGKDGSRAGCVLTIRPANRSRTGAPRIRMNPEHTTQSGSWAAIASARAASHSAREAWSPGATVKVSMPWASARARPCAWGTSEPTATTSTGDAPEATASRTAWRLVPDPETRARMRMAPIVG